MSSMKDRTKLPQYHPSPSDILCDKNTARCNRHAGNQVFRQIIQDHAAQYAVSSKADKMHLTLQIVHSLQAEQGARFLRPIRGIDGWQEIPEMAARDKVSHALRFAAAQQDRKQNGTDKGRRVRCNARSKANTIVVDDEDDRRSLRSCVSKCNKQQQPSSPRLRRKAAIQGSQAIQKLCREELTVNARSKRDHEEEEEEEMEREMKSRHMRLLALYNNRRQNISIRSSEGEKHNHNSSSLARETPHVGPYQSHHQQPPQHQHRHFARSDVQDCRISGNVHNQHNGQGESVLKPSDDNRADNYDAWEPTQLNSNDSPFRNAPVPPTIPSPEPIQRKSTSQSVGSNSSVGWLLQAPILG